MVKFLAMVKPQLHISAALEQVIRIMHNNYSSIFTSSQLQKFLDKTYVINMYRLSPISAIIAATKDVTETKCIVLGSLIEVNFANAATTFL